MMPIACFLSIANDASVAIAASKNWLGEILGTNSIGVATTGESTAHFLQRDGTIFSIESLRGNVLSPVLASLFGSDNAIIAGGLGDTLLSVKHARACNSTQVQHSDRSASGSINGSTHERVAVTCDLGYTGSSDASCQSDGSWIRRPTRPSSLLRNFSLVAAGLDCANGQVPHGGYGQDDATNGAWHGAQSLEDCSSTCRGFEYFVHAPDNDCKCVADCSTPWRRPGTSSIYKHVDNFTVVCARVVCPIGSTGTDVLTGDCACQSGYSGFVGMPTRAVPYHTGPGCHPIEGRAIAYAVGSNGNYQLGDGSTIERHSPVHVGALGSSVVAVEGPISHHAGRYTIFVKSDMTVWTVGSNSHGTLVSQRINICYSSSCFLCLKRSPLNAG